MTSAGKAQTQRARSTFRDSFPSDEAFRAHLRKLALKSAILRRTRILERDAATLADQLAIMRSVCEHRWPDQPDDSSACSYCNLSYSEYGEVLA